MTVLCYFLGVLLRQSEDVNRLVSLSADRLFLPSVLVLNYNGINKAGDKSDIAAFCAHVVELDLSCNQLNNWGEVRCAFAKP